MHKEEITLDRLTARKKKLPLFGYVCRIAGCHDRLLETPMLGMIEGTPCNQKDPAKVD